MDPEIGLFYERIRPDMRYEVIFADKLAGALHESDEDVEGAAAEPNSFVTLLEQLLRGKQSERAERYNPVV